MEDIAFVVNFDYPSGTEDYIHRIGRTARAERHGTAYTLFTSENAKNARDLINVLQEANQQVNPALMQLASLSRGDGGRSEFLYH